MTPAQREREQRYSVAVKWFRELAALRRVLDAACKAYDAGPSEDTRKAWYAASAALDAHYRHGGGDG